MKFLKTAAIVIGTVGALASGVGFLAGAGLIGSAGAFLGVSATTLTTVGITGGVASYALTPAFEEGAPP